VASGHALSQAFYRSFTADPYPLSEAGYVSGTTSRTSREFRKHFPCGNAHCG
jgi:hypothetical protein